MRRTGFGTAANASFLGLGPIHVLSLDMFTATPAATTPTAQFTPHAHANASYADENVMDTSPSSDDTVHLADSDAHGYSQKLATQALGNGLVSVLGSRFATAAEVLVDAWSSVRVHTPQIAISSHEFRQLVLAQVRGDDRYRRVQVFADAHLYSLTLEAKPTRVLACTTQVQNQAQTQTQETQRLDHLVDIVSALGLDYDLSTDNAPPHDLSDIDSGFRIMRGARDEEGEKQEDIASSMWLSGAFPTFAHHMAHRLIDTSSWEGFSFMSSMVHALYSKDVNFYDTVVASGIVGGNQVQVDKITVIFPLGASGPPPQGVGDDVDVDDDALWSLIWMIHHEHEWQSLPAASPSIPIFDLDAEDDDYGSAPSHSPQGKAAALLAFMPHFCVRQTSNPDLTNPLWRNTTPTHLPRIVRPDDPYTTHGLFLVSGDDTQRQSYSTPTFGIDRRRHTGRSANLGVRAFATTAEIDRAYLVQLSSQQHTSPTLSYLQSPTQDDRYSFVLGYVPLNWLTRTRLPMTLLDRPSLFHRIKTAIDSTRIPTTDQTLKIHKYESITDMRGGVTCAVGATGGARATGATGVGRGTRGQVNTVEWSVLYRPSEISSNQPEPERWTVCNVLETHAQLLRHSSHPSPILFDIGAMRIDQHTTLQNMYMHFTVTPTTTDTPGPIVLMVPIRILTSIIDTRQATHSNTSVDHRMSTMVAAQRILSSFLCAMVALLMAHKANTLGESIAVAAFNLYHDQYLVPMYNMARVNPWLRDQVRDQGEDVAWSDSHLMALRRLMVIGDQRQRHTNHGLRPSPAPLRSRLQFDVRRYQISFDVITRSKSALKQAFTSIHSPNITSLLTEFTYGCLVAHGLTSDVARGNAQLVRTIYDRSAAYLPSIDDAEVITRQRMTLANYASYLPSVSPPLGDDTIQIFLSHDTLQMDGMDTYGDNGGEGDWVITITNDDATNVVTEIRGIGRTEDQYAGAYKQDDDMGSTNTSARWFDNIHSSSLSQQQQQQQQDRPRYDGTLTDTEDGDCATELRALLQVGPPTKVGDRRLDAYRLHLPPPNLQVFVKTFHLLRAAYDDDVDGLMMPLMTGGDLGNVIATNAQLRQALVSGSTSLNAPTLSPPTSPPPTTLTLRSLIKGVADIMNALHTMNSLGMSHNDPKPSNIFLDGRQHCFLGDFGDVTPYGTPANLRSLESLPPYVTRQQTCIFDAELDAAMLGTSLLTTLFGLSRDDHATFLNMVGTDGVNVRVNTVDYVAVLEQIKTLSTTEAHSTRRETSWLTGIWRTHMAAYGCTTTPAVRAILLLHARNMHIDFNTDVLRRTTWLIPTNNGNQNNNNADVDVDALPCFPETSRYVCDQLFDTLASLCLPTSDKNIVVGDESTTGVNPSAPVGYPWVRREPVMDSIDNNDRPLGGYASSWHTMAPEDRARYGFVNGLKCAEVRLRLLLTLIHRDQIEIQRLGKDWIVSASSSSPSPSSSAPSHSITDMHNNAAKMPVVLLSDSEDSPPPTMRFAPTARHDTATRRIVDVIDLSSDSDSDLVLLDVVPAPRRVLPSSFSTKTRLRR